MPKVSVILPVYNGEKYIRESIDSIINQTFTDWELIIVNDCSSDGTSEIVHAYEKQDKRIKVIDNTKNERLPRSLNIGFRKAMGDYLTWTSDDNIYLPCAIERMTRRLDGHPEDYMVCAAMNQIDGDGKFLRKHTVYSNQKMMIHNCVGACFLYRKRVLCDVGEYNPHMFLVEDYDYWLRILFRYKNIAYIDEVLYLYRSHDASLTETKKDEIYKQLLNLRKKHICSMIAMSETDACTLSEIYYDFKFNGVLDDDLDEVLKMSAPILKKDVGYTGGDAVIYGAGKFGQIAYQRLKTNIYCFADRDKEKIGREIEGTKIVSLEDMKRLSSVHPIIVAAAPKNVYGLLVTLEELGIEACSVFIP